MRSSTVLPLIVCGQFCCTALWFGGNAVLAGLTAAYGLSATALGALSVAVQLGFIAGTLVFAVLAVADRFSPSRVFLVAALLGAAVNLTALLPGNTLATLVGGRLAVGFLLAGIYPVGMKIAADHYKDGLGRSLGYLVGALVLGTAFPQLVRGLGAELPWRIVLLVVSAVAVAGGLLVGLLVPDGPHRRAGGSVRLAGFGELFANRPLRAAALGYCGHMWELYAFWTLVPVLLAAYRAAHGLPFSVALASFAVIGVGAVGCAGAGLLAERWGARRTAAVALATSGGCCLLAPLSFAWSPPVFFTYLLVWGLAVVADSPLFSTLVARAAPAQRRGTALTLVNCLGFALTVVSITLLTGLRPGWPLPGLLVLLALGPVAGLWGLWGAGAGAR